MKIELRRLTLAALVLSTSATYTATVSAQSFVGDTEADYYGTLGGFVAKNGDNEPPVEVVATVGEEELQAANQPAQSAVRQVASTMYVGDDVVPAGLQTLSPSDRPVAPSHPSTTAQPTGHHSQPTTRYAAGGPCDTQCDTRFGQIASAACSNDPVVWMKSELLLWFPQARTTPPLGVRSAAGSVPLLNPALSPTAVPFGDSFGGDLVPGFRGDIGRYFADGTFGIGGRVWILADENDNLAFGGNGTGVSFGVPFYNTFNGPPLLGEDAIFTGFTDGVISFNGDASIQTSLSIVAAELYGRALVGKSRNHRFELLGGYTHFNIADSLAMRVNSIGLPAAEQTVFNDRFDTRNEFHGGQIGNEISLTRGRWTASSLTKVHLGNMSQRVSVNGSTAQGVLPAPPAVTSDQGLFARGDVRGVRQRDVFAFAPEMNLKLGYQFRDHVNFHVGYSFIYWNNVALAGQQMDRNLYIDSANLGNSGPPRHVDIRSGGFFVQGIDLGATIEF